VVKNTDIFFYFGFIWPSAFRFLEIDQPETSIVYGGHVCKQIETKWAS